MKSTTQRFKRTRERILPATYSWVVGHCRILWILKFYTRLDKCFLEDERKINQWLLSPQTLLSAPKVPEQQFARVLQDSVMFWFPVLLPKASAVGHYQRWGNKFSLALASHTVPILISQCCTAMGMCTEGPRWRRGREAGPGDILSITLKCKEKPTPWTWSVISRVLPKILVQCSQSHCVALHVCWLLLIAVLIGELTNTKPNDLQQKTAVAKFWSRDANCFFTCSLVAWAGHTAGATWLPHPQDLRNHTFSPVSQESPHPGIPTEPRPRRMGCPCNRESNVKNSTGKRMLKAIYWDHVNSWLQMSSLVWLCLLLLIPARVPMPEFGGLNPFVFRVCCALSYGT